MLGPIGVGLLLLVFGLFVSLSNCFVVFLVKTLFRVLDILHPERCEPLKKNLMEGELLHCKMRWKMTAFLHYALLITVFWLLAIISKFFSLPNEACSVCSCFFAAFHIRRVADQDRELKSN